LFLDNCEKPILKSLPLWKCVVNPILNDCSPQVNLEGATGEIKFDENGRRKGIHLEIMNLQGNSLKGYIILAFNV